MGNCVCSCSFNHPGYRISYDEVVLKEQILLETPRKLGANWMGCLHPIDGEFHPGGRSGRGRAWQILLATS